MARSNLKTGDKTGAEVEINARDNTKRAFDSAVARMKAFGVATQAVGAHMMRIGAGMSAVSGTILTALGAAGVQFSALGDQVAKAAARMGTTAEVVSGLRVAADLSGTSVEALESSWRIMQRRITDATRGMQSAQRALDHLGLSAGDLSGVSPDKQFLAIGDALAKIDDPTQRAAAAMEIFGRSGAQLLPLFADGAKGVTDALAFAQENGLIISSADARQAEVLNDSLGALKMVLQDVAFEIGAAVAPSMIVIVDLMRSAAASVAGFIRRNRGLIVAIGVVAAAVGTAGIALTGLGAATYVVGTALTVVQPIIAAASVLWNILAASAATAWVAMAGPVGVIALGLAAVGVSVAALSARMLVLRGTFIEIGSVFTNTWNDITSELASGSLENAFLLAFAGVRPAFFLLLRDLSYGWADFIRSIGGGGSVLEGEFLALGSGFEVARAEAESERRRLRALMSESRDLERRRLDALGRGGSPDDYAPLPDVEASIKGTFSGFAAGLLGRAADDFAARTADAAEDAADDLGEIRAAMLRMERRPGVVFA